jgi:hypothetical protein
VGKTKPVLRLGLYSRNIGANQAQLSKHEHVADQLSLAGEIPGLAVEILVETLVQPKFFECSWVRWLTKFFQWEMTSGCV